MFSFGARRLGPLGLAFTAFRLWRRLSPAQKAAMRDRGRRLVANVRGDRVAAPPLAHPVVHATRTDGAEPEATTAALTPDDLTSPGTVSDPELERRRAEEALVRERESREMEETKFEALRREQEAERGKLASALEEPPSPASEQKR